MKLRALLLFATFLPLACATTGGAGSSLFRREIGDASFRDAYELSLRIVHRHHYEVSSQDTAYPQIRIDTNWRERTPFDDERALGVNRAESRLVITGRARGQSELGPSYKINLIAENRVRLVGSTDWNESTNTAMFRQYADSIVQDFKRELDVIGVRRF